MISPVTNLETIHRLIDRGEKSNPKAPGRNMQR